MKIHLISIIFLLVLLGSCDSIKSDYTQEKQSNVTFRSASNLEQNIDLDQIQIATIDEMEQLMADGLIDGDLSAFNCSWANGGGSIECGGTDCRAGFMWNPYTGSEWMMLVCLNGSTPIDAGAFRPSTRE